MFEKKIPKLSHALGLVATFTAPHPSSFINVGNIMSIISLSILLFYLYGASCERVLKAARRHEGLVKKSNDISLTYEVDLVYAEGMEIMRIYTSAYL